MADTAPAGETPLQNIRIPKDRWEQSKDVLAALGTNRSAYVNDALQRVLERSAQPYWRRFYTMARQRGIDVNDLVDAAVKEYVSRRGVIADEPADTTVAVTEPEVTTAG